MAFPLHNHYLCRVGAWSRTSHARWTCTADVRNLTGMQQSSSLLFCFFSGCFLTKEEQRSTRNCTRSWNWSAESKVRSTAELEQHSTAGQVCLRGNLPNICCLLKQRLNHRQASRHCQEILSKCSWHEPRAARLTHTPSLFCFCGPVTSKMSHGVNKSCITQHAVAQGGYASEVVRNSQNTAWRCRKKLCFFFLLNQPLHASCGRPGPGGHI